MGKPFYAVIIPLTGDHPDQGLPEPSPGHPDQGLPGGGYYPDQGLPGRPDYPSQGPVRPGWGGGERPSHGLPPSFPGRPGHLPARPGRPVDPSYGVGEGHPDQGLPAGPDQGLPPLPPGAPVAPGHLPWHPGGAPDQGLPGGSPGDPQHPIWIPDEDLKPGQGLPVEPGEIWPPMVGLPEPKGGFILAYIPGMGYRYIKVELKPDHGLPGGGAPPTAQPKK